MAKVELDARTLRWAARVCLKAKRISEQYAADFHEDPILERRGELEDAVAKAEERLRLTFLDQARAIEKAKKGKR